MANLNSLYQSASRTSKAVYSTPLGSHQDHYAPQTHYTPSSLGAAVTPIAVTSQTPLVAPVPSAGNPRTINAASVSTRLQAAYAYAANAATCASAAGGVCGLVGGVDGMTSTECRREMTQMTSTEYRREMTPTECRRDSQCPNGPAMGALGAHGCTAMDTELLLDCAGKGSLTARRLFEPLLEQSLSLADHP